MGGERTKQDRKEIGGRVFKPFDLERYREGYLVLGTCFLCGILFAPVLLDYRRLWRRQQLESM
ncbi:MAG: hypothetical protein K2O97_05930 [Acetatifactor sp.]|nr:hypothetical protein [Acetatifactor sp.]MDE7044544.1 hypothetical protein [Acetatifactor sp.]